MLQSESLVAKIQHLYRTPLTAKNKQQSHQPMCIRYTLPEWYMDGGGRRDV